jgi:hypothetical protein
MAKVIVCDICGQVIKNNWLSHSISENLGFKDKKTGKDRQIYLHISMVNIIKPDLCENCFRERAVLVATQGFISKY